MDYNGENQNWSMAQDARGHLFVANNHNLLEYDGVRWRSHAAPNASIFRSVQVNDSLVFTGQYMEFGFWKRDAYGNMGYTSISQGLNMPMVEDEEFWNIITMEDWVLFQSLDRIYSYHLGSAQFKVQDVHTNKAHIFKAAGTVYFQDEVLGLHKIDQGDAVLVLDKAALQDLTIVGLYPQEGALLLIMDNGQFFRLEKERELYEIEGTDVALEALNIYCTVRLADGSLVLGTISQGMFQVTPQGRVVRTIDQRNGLNNNTVLSLFQDRSQNLWLGLDNGISVLNMESPFNEYVDNLGRLGLVYASKMVDGKLYLGTNQGLFVKQRGDASDFQLVRGTEGQVWTLAFLEGTLFCGHNKGTFTVEGEKAQLISPFPGTWTVKEIPGRPNELLQGNYDGLSLLKKEQGQWTFSHVLQGFGISSRFVEVLNKDRILVNHEYKGLFELEVDADYRRVKRIWEHSIMGYGSSIVHFQDRLRYASLDAAFVKKMDTLAFEPDTVLIKLLYEKAGGITGVLKLDTEEQRLWSLTKEGLSHISANSFNGALEVQHIPIPEFFRRSMGVAGFENVERLHEQRYLIGTSNGFVTLDLAKQQQRAHTINISAVRVRQGFGEEPIVLPLGGAEALKNKQNTVSFTYGVAQFNKYSEVRYQYRLQGLFEDWSLWGTDAAATFSNLKYGDYVFQVRAKVGNAPTVNTASYNFTVLRPWYWSGWAHCRLSRGAPWPVLCRAPFVQGLLHQKTKQAFGGRKKETKAQEIKGGAQTGAIEEREIANRDRGKEQGTGRGHDEYDQEE
jgi:AraC family transcriptional regulator, chitin signaling transcriptional activator